MNTVLVLGGYGFFGSRISRALANDPLVHLLIGGRNRDKAAAYAETLGLPAHQAIGVDARMDDLWLRLKDLGITTLVHTAGPFQSQDYRVARNAIRAGCNYIDLADGRGFVAGIGALHQAAGEAGVSVISGASSVPALSSAVVDRYLPEFSRLDSIALGIASGARAPGLATVQGIFGYCGKPFRRWQKRAWTMTHGWLDLRHRRFPMPIGWRWLGSCDIPDLELFPARYPSVHTVTFHAGFASDPGHLLVWSLAGAVRAGILPSLRSFASPLNRLSRWIEPLVSDKGAMFVELKGVDREGREHQRTWHLLASQNHGPHIPCGAAIALVQKLARGVSLPYGAMPCMGFLSVDEYLAPLRDLDVREVLA